MNSPGSWAKEANTGLTDPDQVPQPPADPITQLGDLWLHGQPPPALRRFN